jgi:RNase adapter protein RapZ
MPARKSVARSAGSATDLIIITGLSGSGKGTVLKALEDTGYYAVDNLPLDLLPKFAQLARDSPTIRNAALVVDIREGRLLRRFPGLYHDLRKRVNSRLLFLDADDHALVRRYSETRRPHPLGGGNSVLRSIRSERRQLRQIRAMADHVLNTTELNVHQLRQKVGEIFQPVEPECKLRVYVMSFGFRYGIPPESDLVFDVRFLPNPNYVPALKKLTGKSRPVADYVRRFPQSAQFIEQVGGLLDFLLPCYIQEGKTYLTISFGCTGGHHRSVMMAEEFFKRLKPQGYLLKIGHRDIEKS